MADNDFELHVEDDAEHQINALHQPDSGRAATMILVGCSILQLPIWGTPNCGRARS
jgi:hypothetical protein